MEWINILKCPITSADVRLLTTEEITQLNAKISALILTHKSYRIF